MTQGKPILILGPTAAGKSDLAVGLAEHLDGEVIGADAFQVYRQLDAGTAKPDHGLRQRVPHHLIDIVEPIERFTVHNWLERAQQAIDDIQSRGRRPVIVGGTNLYMKALLDGMFEGPGQDAHYRRSLDGMETPLLHMKLMAVDPSSAERIKPMDRQRIVRALEVFELTGTPISALQTQWEAEEGKGLDAILIGLRWEPEAINPRINLRVKAMFYPDQVELAIAEAVCINGESLVDEAARLKALGLFDPIIEAGGAQAPNQAREALGYKQLLAWMEGSDDKIGSLDEAFEKTKVLTRRFAKQQRTWLKRFTKTYWIDGDAEDKAVIAEQAARYVAGVEGG
ncbi:MAG: tRNA (adenosine(37)-N6)-dimethylallyltransferase MiaA [Planctomycetota bacterium]